MPPTVNLKAIRRLRAWTIVVAAAQAFSFVGCVVAPKNLSAYFFAAALVAGFVFMVLLSQWVRISRTTQGREYLLCPHCGYDTSGVTSTNANADSVRCPECGKASTRTEMARMWRKEVRRL